MMAVKRDYGSFAKASKRLLTPQIEHLGYGPWYGGGFGRQKDRWVEGFFLQQTAYGDGVFSITIGIHVPGLEDYWALDRSTKVFGLLIGWRLNDKGAEQGGDMWLGASDKEHLERSLNRVSMLLAKAEPWFEQFQSFSDVVEQYRLRSNLPKAPGSSPHGAFYTGEINYGFLLLIDNAKDAAREWLQFAKNGLERPKYWHAKNRTIAHEKLAGSKLMKPTKDGELQKRAVEAALARIDS